MLHRNLYYTNNINHAALLLAKKQILESCSMRNGACLLGFQQKDICEKIVQDLTTDIVTVDAKRLFFSIETIKEIVASYK